MNNPVIFTIGYTKRSAENFFKSLKTEKIRLLIDVRLNNTSQLAGYTKRDDLSFFLNEICSCEYKHMPDFAPTKDILDNYKSKSINWQMYELKFGQLLETRKPISLLEGVDIDHTCFLCAEPRPDKCHRRLVAEYIIKHFPNTVLQHL
jgi:uncharacterized protein (DUF488 family)